MVGTVIKVRKETWVCFNSSRSCRRFSRLARKKCWSSRGSGVGKELSGSVGRDSMRLFLLFFAVGSPTGLLQTTFLHFFGPVGAGSRPGTLRLLGFASSDRRRRSGVHLYWATLSM